MLKKKLSIKIQNSLNVEEYLSIIESIGWKKMTKIQVEKALKNSMYLVKIVVNEETVGMGRLIGDFACHGMITDIVVKPEYQKKGLGTKIVLNILQYINKYIKENEKFMIELCPTANHRQFYLNCGFKFDPNKMDGMYLWIEK